MIYVVLIASVLLMLVFIGVLFSRKRGGSRDATLPPMKKTQSGYRVDITESGRYGDVVYSENGKEMKFGWEFGGSVLVVIDIPADSTWLQTSSFPVARRKEIGERVAEEVIRQKAPGSEFRWAGNLIQILND